MLEKAAVILLTFLFFLTSTNYIFLFIERLETIKNQMRENIALINKASDITILKFSFSDYKNKLNWHEKSEFEFDGRMYDVIEIEQSEDGYTIYCLHDEKEEMLISNFKKLNEINGEQKNFVTVQHSNFVLTQ